MPNTRLFNDGPVEIQPAKDRTEPVVWIRRLRLVENLSPDGRTMREIEFRRGLNIICTAKAGPSELHIVGHSVGKTLLLRLIRYCLGEHAYSTKAVRAAIAGVLKDAYVLAEIHVSGRPWVIARPIGLEASRISSWAMEGGDFARLLDRHGETEKFADFVSVLEQKVTETFSGVTLPHAGREANWLDLLAWLSRDQECRYRHQSEWRDLDSESRTGRLEIEDASLVTRMAMAMLDNEEKTLQAAHLRLLVRKKELVSEIARLEAFLSVEEQELRRIIGLDADIDAGELFASAAADKAQETQRQLRGLLAEQESDTRMVGLDRRHMELVAETATIQQRMTEADGTLEEEKVLLKQLEEADVQTFYASFAELGERWCRLFQTEDNATAGGCPGRAAVPLKPGEKDPQQAWSIGECRRHITTLERELAELAVELRAKTAERDRAQREAQDALRRHVEAMGGIRQKIGWWEEVEQRAKRYGECWKSLTHKQDSSQALVKRIEESNEEQKVARTRLEQKRAQLSGYFDYVLKTLISPDAGGDITLEARGIVPRPNQTVASSGQALSTSAMVLGFDLACQIAYVCGLGHLPGFFLHDSPREADMEDALYHRLFHLAVDLEEAFGAKEPSFQYILTTTTLPPKELDREPYVRLRLDARQEEDLLLGVRFTPR